MVIVPFAYHRAHAKNALVCSACSGLWQPVAACHTSAHTDGYGLRACHEPVTFRGRNRSRGERFSHTFGIGGSFCDRFWDADHG